MQKRRFSRLDVFFFALALLLCAAVWMGGFRYLERSTTALKSQTSACFVLLGIVGALYGLIARAGSRAFLSGMVAGLIFSWVGDVAINRDFIDGAAAFALAHVCYFAAYCALDGFRARNLLYGAAIFLLSALLLYSPLFTFRDPSLQLVCLGYALVISLMVGQSFAHAVHALSLTAVLLALGSATFFFSDLMLVLRRFGGVRAADSLCIATYYPAQTLLGLALYTHVYARRPRL